MSHKNVPVYFGLELSFFLVDLTETGINTLHIIYKSYNFTSTVSPQCLVKLQTT